MSILNSQFEASGISINALATRWIQQNAIPPQQWEGTLAQLQAYIQTSSTDCSNWVHQLNFLTSKPNAYSACRSMLNDRYRDQLLSRQGNEEDTLAQFKNTAFGSNTQILIIGGVILFVVILLLI